MHGLSKSLDLAIFVGRELQTVSFYPYTIHFGFDAELSINLESSYLHQVAADGPEDRIDVPPSESTLMQLAGKVVERAEREGEGTLVLRFTEGHVLKLFDDTKWYESYQIEYKGVRTIV